MLLRTWNLEAQLLGGDELLAPRIALHRTLGGILTRYETADPCLPFTAYLRVLLWIRGTLDTAFVRAPALLAGLALVLVLPALRRERLGPERARLLAVLLATSPMLVLYSRIARPYLPIVLLGALSLEALDRWLRAGSARWRRAWVVCTALAIWWHPVSAPFAIAPWTLEVARASRAPAATRRTRLAGLLGGGLALGTVLALLLGPAVPSLLDVLREKHDRGALGLETLRAAGLLLAGTRHPWAAGAFWAAVLIGALRSWRLERARTARELAALPSQLAALVVLSPWGVDHAFIAARYLLIALPTILAWVVVALPVERSTSASGSWRGLAGSLALATASLLAGPLLAPVYRHSSFVAGDALLSFHEPRATLTAAPDLDALAGTSPLLVLPWCPHWPHGRFHAALQERHGRALVVACTDPILSDPRLRLEPLVAARPEAWLSSEAGTLVVVRDLVSEDRALSGGRLPSQFTAVQTERFARYAERQVRIAEGVLGPPDHADERLVVWDLAARRSRP